MANLLKRVLGMKVERLDTHRMSEVEERQKRVAEQLSRLRALKVEALVSARKAGN